MTRAKPDLAATVRAQKAQIKELSGELDAWKGDYRKALARADEWRARSKELEERTAKLEDANAYLTRQIGKLEGYKDRVQELDSIEHEVRKRNQEHDALYHQLGEAMERRDERGIRR